MRNSAATAPGVTSTSSGVEARAVGGDRARAAPGSPRWSPYWSTSPPRSTPRSAERRVRDRALREVVADPAIAQLLGRLDLDRHPPVAHPAPRHGRRPDGAGGRLCPPPAKPWHDPAHGCHAPSGPRSTPASVIVLDGGLATQLEAQGADLSDALWSARLLVEDPAAIVDGAPRVLPGRRAGRDDRLVPGDVRGLRAAGDRARRGGRAPAPVASSSPSEARATVRVGEAPRRAVRAVRRGVDRPVRGDARRRLGVPRPVRAHRRRSSATSTATASRVLAATDADVLAVETIPEVEEACRRRRAARGDGRRGGLGLVHVRRRAPAPERRPDRGGRRRRRRRRPASSRSASTARRPSTSPELVARIAADDDPARRRLPEQRRGLGRGRAARGPASRPAGVDAAAARAGSPPARGSSAAAAGSPRTRSAPSPTGSPRASPHGRSAADARGRSIRR